jgi:hypothetical protein
MSLNDFEYVSDAPIEDDEGVFRLNLADAIIKREKAHEAIDALIDSAGESWFDLGEKLERGRTLDILDNLEEKLVDSEEDAKMVIHILREMITNGEEEAGEGH